MNTKRIIMIMGVQRSGTTALFEALATAPGVTARQESAEDEIYSDWFLRREAEIRSVLADLRGTILLKPVRESEVRSPRAVAEEYRDYDLTIVWLYRDPVNVFDSYLRQKWTGSEHMCALEVATMWQQRNAEALADAPFFGDSLTVVRYEDLTTDPSLISRLASLLGLQLTTRFGSDSALGRKNRPSDLCHVIDQHTKETRARLDDLRSIRPSAIASSPATGPITPSHEPEPDTSQIAECRYLFNAEDQSALHAKWLETGVLRRDESKSAFVSLGYEASRQILARSRPWREVPTLRLAVACREDFDQFFFIRRHTIAGSIGTAVDSWLDELPTGEQFDLHERLVPLAIESVAVWLGVSGETAASVYAVTREGHHSTTGEGSSSAQTDIHSALLHRGLVKELCAAGLLTPESISGFLFDTAIMLFAIPFSLCNALVAIAATPEMMELSRKNPAAIPAILSEAMRLVPLWFSMRRRMNEPLRFGEIDIPQDTTVEVFLATANRDPSVFEKPDTMLPERSGPPALLLDNSRAAFSRLADNPIWGTSHLLFDVSVMVIQKLLTRPQAIEFSETPRTAILPTVAADLLQVPPKLLVQMG